MKLNVLYFAHVRERMGRPSEQLTCPDGATAAQVWEILCQQNPSLGELEGYVRFAVDGEFISKDAPIPDGAEFVIIPPVSGGADLPLVHLTEAPLDDAVVASLIREVTDAGRGAVVTFQGVVRDHARGHAVTDLHYEAYASMALRVMEDIAREVEEAVGDVRVAVHHRTGSLKVGDVAVVVVAASAHRSEAFEATRRMIDRLKEDVPIWKRERGPDGDEWVSDRP